ncbi:MAG: hypothetical protein KVP17_000395 [Porospora cf. gigantea B]|uniref:uncharacterized protein n=1 Tax=Porospora cf. gigantea B TaxID=2853592 RepID=UPI003571D014|nr:MAG: hypothetical protein KVP17_000395 [Porospora cf. gigantea B]
MWRVRRKCPIRSTLQHLDFPAAEKVSFGALAHIDDLGNDVGYSMDIKVFQPKLYTAESVSESSCNSLFQTIGTDDLVDNAIVDLDERAAAMGTAEYTTRAAVVSPKKEGELGPTNGTHVAVNVPKTARNALWGKPREAKKRVPVHLAGERGYYSQTRIACVSILSSVP